MAAAAKSKLCVLSRRLRGVAIVEYVIVLPLLLILIMGTAEFGRAFMQYNTLSKAVQDGARHVAGNAMIGSTGTVTLAPPVVSAARNLVAYGNPLGVGSPLLPGLTTGDVTVVNLGGGAIRVTATYPYGSIFAFIPRFAYGADINVSAYTFQAGVTMRAL